ncbi:MAG: hypothetical protein K2M31_07865 [Muribaculaceae bacterium]|nr:hypothetical protein [Muribaculaceae bacterium]
MATNNQNRRFEERKAYVEAFNSTMIKIWKERIAMLNVIDTGRLLRSVVAVSMTADAKYTSVSLSQSFRAYGLFVDYGVGSNTPRGNSGDLGHDNKRRRKRWFSRKYYASVMNIREFYADNLGKNLADTVSNALSHGAARQFALKVDKEAF